MTESVGTVHLSISADLDTLEARLKQRFAVLGKQLGDQLGQDIGRQATRGVETSMAAVAKTAFTPLEQSAKAAGRRISDNLDVSVKTDKAKAQLDSLAKQKRIVELTADANTRQAEAKLAEFDARENQLRIDVDAGTDGAQAKLDALLGQRRTFEIQVEAQTLRAKEQLDRLDEKRTAVIEADAQTDGARAKLDELSKSASGAGFGLNGMGLAVAVGTASMGTLIPVAVAATGAVLALGVAAVGVGSAFGVAKLAFSGVGTAITALDAQQSKAGENAAKAATAAISMANAQDSLKSAIQGVADAHTQAAQASEAATRKTSDAVQALSDAEHQAGLASQQAAQQTASAAQGVQDAVATAADRMTAAEQALRTAQQDELVAQQDLTRAREEATRQLQDMAASNQDAKLRERQATLDLQQAEDNLLKAQESRKSTPLAIQQAILQRDMAKQALVEAQTAAQRTADDNTKAQKAGVEGSDVVVAAKQKVKDANDKVRQSEADIVKTRLDGARNIAQAEQALANAQQNQSEVARKNAENIAKAQRDLADARKNEGVVAQQNAQNIAKAEQGVVQAQRGIQAALVATQQIGATTQNAVNEAFANLSPAGQHFAKFIYGLTDGPLKDLRFAAQTALLPALETAIKILLPYLPQVQAFVTEVGRAMGDVAIKIARSLTGPEWKAFFTAVRDQAPGDIRKIGDMFVSVGKVIARVFTAAAPYAKPLLDAISGFFKRIDDETSGAKGKNKLQALFQGIMPTLGAVWNVVSAIGRVLWSIVSNGSGSQGSAADTLNKVADAINRLANYIDKHPEVVSKIMGIAAGLVAIRAANPVISVIGNIGMALNNFAGFADKAWKYGSKLFDAGALLGEGGAMTTALEAVGAAIGAISAPVLIVIGVIALLVGAFVIAYLKVKWFHDGVNAIVHAIGDFFVWLWQNAISPVLHAIGALFVWLYSNVVKPYWSLIHTAIQIGWGLIEVIFGLIEIGIKILAAAWSWLYDHAVKPIWDAISSHIGGIWRTGIRPIFDTIGSYIRTNVAPKFKSAIGVLQSIWDGLMEMFKAPIRFLIQTVLDDGLFAAYNWVAKKFNVKPDNVNVPVPAVLQPTRKATGGGISGPGTGTSDSIPALLSNGEHVWTAREVQAAGGHGAVEAIRAMVLKRAGVPGYASGGGVFGWIKDKVSSAGSWIWNKAKDIGGAVKDFVSDPLGTLQKVATSVLRGLPGGTDGLLGHLLVGMANKAVSGISDFALSLMGLGGGGGGGSSSGGGSVGPVPGGSGVSRWRPMVLKALAAQGLSASLADRVLRQIATESGGNPSVIQQVHDVNWPNNRAQGLLQVIPSTFRAYHVPGTSNNELDAWANIMASLNYAKHVYGSGLSGMGNGHGYDSGGWLMPGTQIVHNDTGRPEAVFSPSQWATLEANLAGALGDGADYSKTTTIDVHTYGDPNAIATAIAAEQERADLLDAISL